MARGDRSVDVFVRKLRQKLERVSPDWRNVHTHFGIGYRFAAELADGTASAAAMERAGATAQTPAGDALPARESAPARESVPARESARADLMPLS